MQRKFVTSDTHGCAERLRDCLTQANFDYKVDQLIHLGDVVDRGPDSKGVVDLLLSITNLISIKGNHDHWWLEYLVMRHGAPNIVSHMTQGGSATLTSYVSPITGGLEIPEAHINFFKKQIPYYLDDENRFFTHAGYDRTQLIENQEEEVFAWDRDLMRQAMCVGADDKLNDVNGFKRTFIGHCSTTFWTEQEAGQYSKATASPIITMIDGKWPRKCETPIYKGHIVDVDTGGCYGGKISLLDITDDNAHILYQA